MSELAEIVKVSFEDPAAIVIGVTVGVVNCEVTELDSTAV